MKTRNGLVSNSSSASFIIIWRSIFDGDDKDRLEETLNHLFRFLDKEKCKFYCDRTAELKSGAYKTTFSTTHQNFKILLLYKYKLTINIKYITMSANISVTIL